MNLNTLNNVGRRQAPASQNENLANQAAGSAKPSQSRPAPLWDNIVLNNDADFSALPGTDSGSTSLAPSAPLSPSFGIQPASPSGFPTRSILQPRGPAKDGRKRKRSRLTADLMPFDSVDYWLEFDNDNLTADSAPVKPDNDFDDIDFSVPQPPAATSPPTTTQQPAIAQRQQSMAYPVRTSNPMKLGDILDDTALENALSDEDNDFSSMNLADQLSKIDSMPSPEIPPRGDLYSTPLSWERPQMNLGMESLMGWPTTTLTPEERARLIAIAMNPGTSMGGLGYNLGANFGLGGGIGPGFGGFGSSAGFGPATSWMDEEAMKIAEPKAPAKAKEKEKEVKIEKTEKCAKEKATDKEKLKPGDRSAHNDIERKYRMNLKDRIAELRDAVPSLKTIPEEGGDDDDEEGASQPSRAAKASKGTVLTKATEYIQFLEKKNKAITQQHRELSRRIQAFEQLLSATAARPIFQMPTYSRTLFDPRAFC